jgi:peptidoglycan LD-endopeptidase LytH
MSLKIYLEKHKAALHPLFIPNLTLENTLMMDFSSANNEMKAIDFQYISELNDYVFSKISAAGKPYGYGGYLEDREIYRRSSVFDLPEGDSRSIHLGVDVWVAAGREVFCPLDGVVHSFKNNNNYGDYGPTIILQHHLEGTVFFTLYGHLSADSLDDLYEGKAFKAGSVLCRVGNFPINGDWPPHLHFQVIADMKSNKGDFPGVCSKAQVKYYEEVCPNPRVFFAF